jgi:hypothetical protein
LIAFPVFASTIVRALVSIASFYTPTRVKMGDGIRRGSVVTSAGLDRYCEMTQAAA